MTLDSMVFRFDYEFRFWPGTDEGLYNSCIDYKMYVQNSKSSNLPIYQGTKLPAFQYTPKK